KDWRRYDVACFDLNTRTVRFKPIRRVIRHAQEEKLYQITTLYNRSVTVTSSHSVFVFENERVLLKKGNEIRRGDLVVCPKRLPRVESLQKEIDLLALFGRDDLSQDLYAHGESVRRIAAARLLAKVRRPELWSEPRVALNEKVWGELAAHR